MIYLTGEDQTLPNPNERAIWSSMRRPHTLPARHNSQRIACYNCFQTIGERKSRRVHVVIHFQSLIGTYRNNEDSKVQWSESVRICSVLTYWLRNRKEESHEKGICLVSWSGRFFTETSRQRKLVIVGRPCLLFFFNLIRRESWPQ